MYDYAGRASYEGNLLNYINKEKECIIILMENSSRVIGKMTRDMDLEHYCFQMEIKLNL